MSGAAVDEAVASGLSDVVEEDETIKPDDVTRPTVVEVDTSGDRDDDGNAVDAEATPLPVRLEPSDATVAGMSLVPVRDELKGLTELAVTLAIADNTPSALKGKPASVLAVFLTGRELGIPPMTALRNLHVIDGKVTVNPKVRAAMVRREGLGKLWPHQGPREYPCPNLAVEGHGLVGADEAPDPLKCMLCLGTGKVVKLCECGSGTYGDNDDEVATWHAKRADDPFVIYSSTYTMAMAKNVDDGKLVGKNNWKNYPDRMLSWRSLGYLLDDAFPEVGTGLYSPDELGAITDEEGEPVIDVASTEVLTERASKDRKDRNDPPADPPASPDTIKMFQERIEKMRGYEGAIEALVGLWSGQRPSGDPGEPLPKVENLLYRQCKTAAALLDMIERRIGKGEFVQIESDADIVDDQGPEKDSGDETGDGGTDPDPDPSDAPEDSGVSTPDEDPPVPETASEGVETTVQEQQSGPLFDLDVDQLPSGTAPADDLAWAEAALQANMLAGRALIDEVAVEVHDIPAGQLTAVMKALDLSANGLNEATKRARIAARRVRLRIQKSAGGE